MKKFTQTTVFAAALLAATATTAFANREPALSEGCKFIKSLSEYTCPTCGC